jgi:hypothetical protein
MRVKIESARYGVTREVAVDATSVASMNEDVEVLFGDIAEALGSALAWAKTMKRGDVIRIEVLP